MDHENDAEVSEWDTISADGPDLMLSSKGLDQLLSSRKSMDSIDDSEHPHEQIGIRSAPPGFRAVCNHLARQYRISYSKFVRLALKHGAAILAADNRLRSLKRAYQALSESAIDSGDPASLARLDQPQSFEFLRTNPVRTTLSCMRKVVGDVADLSRTCGVHVATMGVIAIYCSLMTLPNERGYRKY